jgi:peroxiredoxin
MLIALFAWLSCPQSSLSADAEKDSSAEEVQSAETADEKLPEGHSNHGEIFNEGPRQAAYLMDGVGRISFGVTSDLPKAVALVVQGVGQLHGFWYFESERSFRQAAAIDPQCAIAYWGMAMSNRKNADRAKGFISRAMELKDDASRREQLYIEAFDRYINAADEEDTEKEERAAKYIEDLEDLLFEFPDDIEAKAFLCEFQWSARRDGLEFNSYLAVDALIQQIHAVEPLHPAHHYRIHLWDRKKAEMALEAAAHCGPAAPAIAHMWHMPGHIYSRLHRYHDAVWQQEASARVDHAHMMKDMVLPDQIHNFAHNNEWCIRNLIHIGRVHDAIDLAKNMIELPRHPEYNHIEESGSYKYGRQRLLGVLQTFELHEDLIRLADSSWLQHTGDETADLAVDRALAAACVSTGRVADAESVREKLSAQLEELKKPQPEDADDADKTTVSDEKDEKDDEAIRKAADAAKKKHDTRAKALQNALDDIAGRLAGQRGDYDVALELLEKVDDVSVEEVTAILLAAGDTEAAVTRMTKHVDENPNQVRPLAALIRTHWKVANRKQARTSFETLRSISSTIDLDIPVFAELAPVAAELGYGEDWRLDRERPQDLGIRPELDSLGPIHWQPVAAPDWTLPGVDNLPLALGDFRGKPLIVIFYLGYGCLHCAEQLQKFHPEVAKFREAGFELVAISTDRQELLSKAHENYDGDFTFPLLADPDLSVFRRYRCFDDFEQQPLHGTFVLDAEGLVRWQDISYQPFMDPTFVLEEAQRLMNLTCDSPPCSSAELAASESSQGE